jgi:hypothetical protein
MRLPEIAAQSLASLLTCSYYAQYLFKICTIILFAKEKFCQNLYISCKNITRNSQTRASIVAIVMLFSNEAAEIPFVLGAGGFALEPMLDLQEIIYWLLL